MRKFLVLSIFFIPTLAQTQELKDWSFSIGPGFIFKNNLYKDNRYSSYDKKIILRPIPFFQGKYSRLSLGAGGISLRAYGNLVKNISVSVGSFQDRYQSIDINKRYTSLNAGVTAVYYGYSFEYRHDIQARSQGSTLKVGYTKMFPINASVIVMASAALEWFDDYYANYYFSVKPHQSQARFKTYQSKNYLVPSVGLLPIYKISEHFSTTVGAFLKFYPQSVTSSPIMDGKQLEYSTLVGFSYNM